MLDYGQSPAIRRVLDNRRSRVFGSSMRPNLLLRGPVRNQIMTDARARTQLEIDAFAVAARSPEPFVTHQSFPFTV